MSRLSEQSGRLQQQHDQYGGVDKESAELRDQHLTGGVAETQQQRRDEGAADRPESADGDDDQEIDELLHGVAWRDRDDIGAKAAAKRGEPTAEREHQHEQKIGVDAQALRHRTIVDRGANAGADHRAVEPKPQSDEQHEADDDQKSPIGRKGLAEEGQLPADRVWDVDALRQGTEDEVRNGRGHKDQSNAEQGLLELARSI